MDDTSYSNIRKTSQDSQALIHIQKMEEGCAYIRLAACKARESYLNREASQDFAAYRADANGLAFAVLDGVGSTFHGDIASAFLGQRLVEWLFALPPSELAHVRDVQVRLEEQLQRWFPICQEQVMSYKISQELPELLSESLHDTREQYGSETTFACGRIWLSEDGRNSGIFLWAGDTKIQAWDDDQKLLPLPNEWHSNNRWSSKKGLKGSLHFWSTSIGASLGHLLVFTDGYTDVDVDEGPSALSDQVLHKKMLQALLRSNSDDLTRFEAVFKNGRLPGPAGWTPLTRSNKKPGSPLPGLQEPDGKEGYEVNWDSVDGAILYVLETAERTRQDNLLEFRIAALTSETSWKSNNSKIPIALRLRVVNEEGESTACRMEIAAGGSPLYSSEIPAVPLLMFEPKEEDWYMTYKKGKDKAEKLSRLARYEEDPDEGKGTVEYEPYRESAGLVEKSKKVVQTI
jgi:ribosomal protein L31E